MEEDAGWRSRGGIEGAASGSEVSFWGEVGGTWRPSSSVGELKVTFFAGVGFFIGSAGSSVTNEDSSVPISVRPSSMFAFRSSRSMRDGLSPSKSSCRSRTISSGDICAILFLFSSSILLRSLSSDESPTSVEGPWVGT